MAKTRNSVLFLLLMLLLWGCRNTPQNVDTHYIQFSGPTMGTEYHITVDTRIHPDSLKAGVDSILEVFNLQLSTYIPESTISQFNQNIDTFRFHEVKESHFYRNVKSSFDLYEQTNGYYDPTVMPLVNYWGFGYKKRERDFEIDSSKVDRK